MTDSSSSSSRRDEDREAAELMFGDDEELNTQQGSRRSSRPSFNLQSLAAIGLFALVAGVLAVATTKTASPPTSSSTLESTRERQLHEEKKGKKKSAAVKSKKSADTESWPTQWPTLSPSGTSKPTHDPSYTQWPTLSPAGTSKPTHDPSYTHSPTKSPINSNVDDEDDATDDDDDDDAESSSSKPHIVFILADDLGWNSVGAADSELAFVAPTLTDMALNGLVFPNYYAQEVCTPSRAALMTGRYPLSIGMQYGVVQGTMPWGLPLNETMLPQVLKEHGGYDTYMIGKWHLGHHTPEYLPTARGFDAFMGYVSGESHYFSKRNPTSPRFHDFITADSMCYYAYNGSDMHTYSTYFYRDLAVDIINAQDPNTPMYLYLAFQAVHSPFSDIKSYTSGVPTDYITDDMYEAIHSNITGRRARQYALTFNLLDEAVGEIKTALEDKGMMDNTYIIFASDNGGCYLGGGKNYPLRGTKGSMLEGGVHVDAFIYSPMLLPSAAIGAQFNPLMHVSDWFPTIMEMAGIVTFTPLTDYELDGISQYGSFADPTSIGSREYMLYNSYSNISGLNSSDDVFAIRNSQYKLIGFYDGSDYAEWYADEDVIVSDDDNLWKILDCSQRDAMDGNYTLALYDLFADPYETTNLYNSTIAEYMAAQEELEDKITYYRQRTATVSTYDEESDDLEAEVVFTDAGGYMVPYYKLKQLHESKNKVAGVDYPVWCGDSQQKWQLDLTVL